MHVDDLNLLAQMVEELENRQEVIFGDIDLVVHSRDLGHLEGKELEDELKYTVADDVRQLSMIDGWDNDIFNKATTQVLGFDFY